MAEEKKELPRYKVEIEWGFSEMTENLKDHPEYKLVGPVQICRDRNGDMLFVATMELDHPEGKRTIKDYLDECQDSGAK